MCPLPTSIGGGPGNENPEKEFFWAKAGEAISRGETVCWSHAAADGYTVILTDNDAAATAVTNGVATSDVASGSWGKFQRRGLGDYLVTDGNVAAGQILLSDATAGAATGVAYGTATNLNFGQAIAADSGTLCTSYILWCP